MQLRIPGQSALTDPALPPLDAASEPPPMSAARLAAEAAFGVSQHQPAGQPPSVTVRRVRGAGGAVPAAEPAPTEKEAADGRTEGRGPRVFRLVPGAPSNADGSVGSDQVPVTGPQSELVAVASESLSARRSRRGSAVQRPGPVVQIFKATSDASPAAAQALLPMELSVTFDELAALQRMLDSIQPLLEEAQRASAFRVFD